MLRAVEPGTTISSLRWPAWLNAAAVPSLLVVRPERHEGLARLREAGVWLAMDPQAIAACISDKSFEDRE